MAKDVAHISRQEVTLLYKLYLSTLSLAMIPRKEVLTYGNLATDGGSPELLMKQECAC